MWGAMRIVNRYDVQEKIGQGGMGIVYRVKDRLNGQVIALKQVRIREGIDPSHTLPLEASFATRYSLAQEFRTLVSLRHPHIVSVLDYGFDEQSAPYFTMSYIEEGQPITHYAKPLPQNEKIVLLIQCLESLHYLHQRGILHCDLKPDNVFVARDGTVKVMDFGLASQGAQEQRVRLTGTLAYMSPELLHNALPTVTSDLYAFGVIAYEVLVGAFPYTQQTMTELIDDILNRIPAVANLENVALGRFLERLLSKSPRERYATAKEAIAALSEAVDISLMPETLEIRESFLQASRFVGRETELKHLQDALQQAKNGQGSAWLLAGESGVGKSRILEELRTVALIEGVAVLRGQAIAEVGVLYQLWRDVVRRIVLSATLSDLEAGILKELVPDIEQLLERTVGDVPRLEAKAMQQRLIATIVGLLQRQQTPMLLFLEDLHWSVESLDVLRQLLPFVADCPWVIVGTYRDDETPHLPDVLPQMQVMKVQRLSKQAIADLCEAILGAENSRQTPLLQLIERESEGNVLFVIEVLRVLAQEAGELEKIGNITLPPKIFAQGVLEIVSRRLAQIPESARALLELVAVVGRQIDSTFLETMPEEHPPYGLEAWLDYCVNASILELQENQWRFAHDKLRESVLAGLSEDRSKQLHRKVAQYVERAYPNNRDYAGLLMEYWRKAENPEKELVYIKIAGERFLVTSAFSIAKESFQRALQLLPESAHAERLYYLIQLAEVFRWLDEFVQARKLLEDALVLAQEVHQPSLQALIFYELSQLAVLEGALDEGLTYLALALPLARQSQDTSVLLRTLYGYGDIYWHKAENDVAKPYLDECLALCRSLNEPKYTMMVLNRLGGLYDDERSDIYLLECYALASKVGSIKWEWSSLNNLGANRWYAEDYEAAREYYLRAYEKAILNDSRRLLAFVQVNLALVSVVLDKPEEALSYSYPALQIVLEIEMPAYQLFAIISFAGVLGLLGQKDRGLQWIGCVLNHSLFYGDFARDVWIIINKVWGDYPREAIDAQLEAGKVLSYEVIIQQILARTFLVASN